MGRGLGVRQRELLAALRDGDPAPLAVTENAASHSERSALRRAARGLVERGFARAVYVRAPNSRGAYGLRLALVLPSAEAQGEFLPRLAPAWVTPPPLSMQSLSTTLQAHVLEHVTGLVVSRSTANRIARRYREEQEEENAA